MSWRLLAIAAAAVLVMLALEELRLVVLPVIAALLLATFLVPPTRWLRRRGWPSALAASTVMVTSVLVLAGLLAAIAPAIADELDELGSSAREGIERVGDWLVGGPLGLSEQDLDRAIDSALGQLRENSALLAGGLFNGALIALEIVAGALLAVVLVFFFLKDGERMWDGIVGLLPERRRKPVREIGESGWATLSAYMRGIALVALVDSVLVGIVALTAGAVLGGVIGAFLAVPVAAVATAVASDLRSRPPQVTVSPPPPCDAASLRRAR